MINDFNFRYMRNNPFYRDDHVNFKAIIWKRSRTIGTTEGYPRGHRFFPVIENKFGPDGVEAENIIYKN